MSPIAGACADVNIFRRIPRTERAGATVNVGLVITVIPISRARGCERRQMRCGERRALNEKVGRGFGAGGRREYCRIGDGQHRLGLGRARYQNGPYQA